MHKDQHTNALIHETSPYLLQHAHNPVNWVPWGDKALEQAKAENKLLIISIGYSACHWCHVMEHESFEDSAAAALMNEHFVSIKVDREERPDIDNLYMNAVQLMTGRGGWPLNCIALPDGRPIWGGTYFPKDQWMKALQDIHNIYLTDPKKVLEYADNLESGIKNADLVEPVLDQPNFKKEDLEDMVENWKRRFDTIYGGPDKAPKFPLPNNYQFLLRYGWLSNDEQVTNQVKLTLKEMAFGGIYDQIGGGFARYSVDQYWKAPHFEKMLYDNAQLMSLYSEAYRAYRNPLYKEVIKETFDFLTREMLGPENQFYAALDADSEGEEGKFYVWQKEELVSIIPEDEWSFFEAYYNINHHGRWEDDNYILLRKMTDEEFAEKHSLDLAQLENMVANWKFLCMNIREQRNRPSLDSKALTGWNAMMVKGLADAYLALNEREYLRQALKTARFIRENLVQANQKLYHTYSPGEAKINGFLEDYAAVIDAWITMYQVTGDEAFLEEAATLTNIVLQEFDAGENGLFYFTPKDDALLSRSLETNDNVIPASNSVMAKNLYALGVYLENPKYLQRAEKMTMQIKENIYRYGEGFSNWGILMLHWTYPSYEVVVSGPKADQVYSEFASGYYPNILPGFSTKASELPLLANRYSEATRIFVCQNNTCQLPVENIEDAWVQIVK